MDPALLGAAGMFRARRSSGAGPSSSSGAGPSSSSSSSSRRDPRPPPQTYRRPDRPPDWRSKLTYTPKPEKSRLVRLYSDPYSPGPYNVDGTVNKRRLVDPAKRRAYTSPFSTFGLQYKPDLDDDTNKLVGYNITQLQDIIRRLGIGGEGMNNRESLIERIQKFFREPITFLQKTAYGLPLFSVGEEGPRVFTGSGRGGFLGSRGRQLYGAQRMDVASSYRA